MKKLFLSILSIGFVFVFLTKCDVTEEHLIYNNSTRSDFSKENPFYSIGVKHNEGLDFILKEIKRATNMDTKKTPNSLTQLTEYAGISYFNKTNMESSEFVRVFNELKNSEGVLSLQKVSSDSSWSNGLNKEQLYFINRILNLYDTVEDSLVFGDSLNLIDNQALNKLSELDAKIILVTSAIAYKSKIYWSENFDVWFDAIQQYLGNNSLPKQTDLATIGKEDVKGAVGGAVGAVVTGCAEMTLGACIGVGALAGGVAGSVAEAVGELIDWLWG